MVTEYQNLRDGHQRWREGRSRFTHRLLTAIESGFRPSPLHIHNRNETAHMTESINTTTPADDDDVFEAASRDFVSKADFKDRLVMIYPTGKTEVQMSKTTGKSYTQYETYTVVLDDGPDGYQENVLDTDQDEPGMRPNRIPSVAEHGPQVAENYRWSAGGIASQITGKAKMPAKNGGVPGGVLGRVNALPIKGKSAAWGLKDPTEADRALAVEPEIKAARLAARDEIVASLKAAEVEDAF